MTVSLYQNRYFFPNIKVSFQKKKACSASRVFAACKGPGESPERPFPAGACAVPTVSEGRQPVGVRVSGKVCPVRGTAEVSLTPSARQQDGLPGADAAGQAPSPQNHRIVGVGRDLCGSSCPTPCPSRVTQSRLHRTLSRRGWNISREGDSTASLGSLGQGSVTLRGKKFFLGFRRNFLCLSLCPGVVCWQ